jgi:hypothetical protein
MEGTMALAEFASQPEHIALQPAQHLETRSPIARLAELHAEAQETARLANLLGRSVHAAVALVVMGIAAMAFVGAVSAESLTWLGFVLIGAAAITRSWHRTMQQPFERAALKSFSQDLDAIMAFAGTAWGAGAFLALAASADIATVLLFAAGTAAVIAVLLREHESALHFLAPVTALTSFACVLRPLPAGALAAALILIACSAVAMAVMIAARWNARAQSATELPVLPFA